MNTHFIAATACGAKHLWQAKACQDAYAACTLSGTTTVCAVADGAGSASCAAEAAALAVSEAIQHARQVTTWSESAMKTLFAAVHQSLLYQAQSTQNPLWEYSSTLLVTILRQDTLYCGQVGDGAIVYQTRDNGVASAGIPQRQSLDHTQFISQPDWLAHFHYQQVENCRAVSLHTDGVDPVCTDLASGEIYPPFFQRLFDWFLASGKSKQLALEQFVTSDLLASKSDDDKTLVMAKSAGVTA